MDTQHAEHEIRLRRLAAAARTADQAADDARQARDTAIEQADLDGWSTRRIADATGMSHSRIQVVVLTRTATRQDRHAKTLGLSGPPLP